MRKKTARKKNKNSKDDDSDFVVDSDHSDDDTVSVESDTKKAGDMKHNSDNPPPDVYFKCYFSFLLWGYIPPPGYEDYKSLAMATIEKKGDKIKNNKKSIGRAAAKKKKQQINLLMLNLRGKAT